MPVETGTTKDGKPLFSEGILRTLVQGRLLVQSRVVVLEDTNAEALPSWSYLDDGNRPNPSNEKHSY